MPMQLRRLIPKDKVIVLAALAVVVGAGAALRVRQGDRTPAQAGAPARVSSAGEFRGIALQVHNGDAKTPYEQYVDEIAATGANTISLVVAAYQENIHSTSIFIDMRKAPSDSRLRGLIQRARRKGMQVVLMPIVLLENPGENEWRGKISPANSNWADWWEDYTNFIMHYTYLAQSTKVDLLMIGSELVSTESQTDRWRGLIARIRKHYGGRISYSANWDHYKPIKWWKDLDLISMQCYHDLTGGDKPTVERIEQGWRPVKKKILEWQKTINRPILFSEVGWPNQVTCAQYPWDYYRSVDKPDPQAQANCFEAFFRTWIDEPAVAGFIVWEWRSRPDQVTSADKDTSYVPCDKPAMEVIKKYLRYVRPSEATEPSGPATQPSGG